MPESVRNFLALRWTAIPQKSADLSRIPPSKLADCLQTLFNVASPRNGSGRLFSEIRTMRGPGSPASLLFRLVIPATAAFVITILAMIAVLFGDDRAPFAQVINRYGNAALVIEFILIIALTLASMTADRIATLRQMRTGKSFRRSSSSDDPSNTTST